MRWMIPFLLLFGAQASAQSISNDELLGKVNPANHPDFVKISAEYTTKSDIYLRKEAYEAFKKMAAHAAKDGISLIIISATRSFNYQKNIWERKWSQPKYMGWQSIDKAKDILSYSSMPGSSRHHWGTDIDLNALNNEWFTSGEGKQVYDWLVKHAPTYGFAQVYTAKSTGRTGYNEEKWHWSYLPLASAYLKSFNEGISDENIVGFKGDDLVKQLRIIPDFVNGIEAEK